MSYFLSPIGNSQIVDANGDPLVGGSIWTYLAGTSTGATTYTDDTGGTAQGLVMGLNSLGLPVLGPVWMLGGQPLKFIIKNAANVTLLTYDDISGIGDTSTTPDQFPFIAPTPTYISATSFSFVGDQTNDAQVSRRIRSINTGGTIYGTIVNAVFAAGVTTVTVVNDSGVLDSGLSQVSYGLISATNNALPIASTAVTGAVELATTAEVQAGTDTGRVPSVSAMQNGKSKLNASILTTSGTAINQTGIPAYAKQVTIGVMGVSASGTSQIILRLGTTLGIESASYSGSVTVLTDALTSVILNLTTGFIFTTSGTAAQIFHGSITLRLVDSATNRWSCTALLGRTDALLMHIIAGTKALAGVLDRVQLTTVGGVDTFDAGSISVTWE